MNQLNTEGIILARTDFGEADRIITFLTPNYGKLRLIAKGVRKVKSKLAGGVELFSVSQISFIKGRGEMGTLVSARLLNHYGVIVKDINRTMLGYELIKILNKTTEDEPDSEYFDLLHEAFQYLNETRFSETVIRLWFNARLLRMEGHTPNLLTDAAGNKLRENKLYNFDLDNMAFSLDDNGLFDVSRVKFMRLLFSGNKLEILQKVNGVEQLVEACWPDIREISRTYLRGAA